MKKIFLVSILSIFLITGTVDANIDTNTEVNNLPSAGITPDSPFYFLDIFGENIEEFFTFNPEAKAKLQIKFAGERISEIREMVKNDGIGSKGIQTAKKLLLANVAQATSIVKKEKITGKDVTKLAKNIDDSFNAQEELLAKTFQDARKKLEKDRVALKQNLIRSDTNGKVNTNIAIAKNDSSSSIVNRSAKSINDSKSIDVQMKLLDKDMNDLNGMQNDFNNLFDNGHKKIEKELGSSNSAIKEGGVNRQDVKKIDIKEDINKIEAEKGDTKEVSNENGVNSESKISKGRGEQKDSEGVGRSSEGRDEGVIYRIKNRDKEGE